MLGDCTYKTRPLYLNNIIKVIIPLKGVFVVQIDDVISIVIGAYSPIPIIPFGFNWLSIVINKTIGFNWLSIGEVVNN